MDKQNKNLSEAPRFTKHDVRKELEKYEGGPSFPGRREQQKLNRSIVDNLIDYVIELRKQGHRLNPNKKEDRKELISFSKNLLSDQENEYAESIGEDKLEQLAWRAIVYSDDFDDDGKYIDYAYEKWKEKQDDLEDDRKWKEEFPGVEYDWSLSYEENVEQAKKLRGNTMTEEKWIQKAVKRPGALHKALGIPEDEEIPMVLLRKKKAELQKKGEGDKKLSPSDSKLLKQIIFAINTKTLKEAIQDYNDIIKEEGKVCEECGKMQCECGVTPATSQGTAVYEEKKKSCEGCGKTVCECGTSGMAAYSTMAENKMNKLKKLYEAIKSFKLISEKSPPGYEKQVEATKKALLKKGYSEERAANIAFGKAWNEYKEKKSK